MAAGVAPPKTMYTFQYSVPNQVAPGSQAGADEEPETVPEPEPDSTYKFGYENKDSTRQEESDAVGNVQGSFSYVDPEGSERRVEYEAGAGRGFVIKEDVTVAGPGRGSSSSSSSSAGGLDQQTNPVFDDGDVQQNIEGGVQLPGGGDVQQATESPDLSQSTEGPGFLEEGPDDSQQTQQAPVAPTDEPAVGTTDETPIARPEMSFDIRVDDKIDLRVGSGGDNAKGGDRGQAAAGRNGQADGQVKQQASTDGGYAFSYETPDQHREEEGDGQGHVRGSFSFVAEDNINRTVEYEAGPETGFIARGDHLPKPQPSDLAAAGGDSTESPVGDARSQQTEEQATEAPEDKFDVRKGADDGDEQQAADEGSGGGGDASYSYQYETDTSIKIESSDAQGNVQGMFAYVDGSGAPKTVTYTARAGEGFKADGDHLPRPGQFLVSAAAARVADVHGGARGGLRRGPAATKTAVASAVVPAAGPLAGPHPPCPAMVPDTGAGHLPAPDGASVRVFLPPGHPCHKVGYVYEDTAR